MDEAEREREEGLRELEQKVSHTDSLGCSRCVVTGYASISTATPTAMTSG